MPRVKWFGRVVCILSVLKYSIKLYKSSSRKHSFALFGIFYNLSSLFNRQPLLIITSGVVSPSKLTLSGTPYFSWTFQENLLYACVYSIDYNQKIGTVRCCFAENLDHHGSISIVKPHETTCFLRYFSQAWPILLLWRKSNMRSIFKLSSKSWSMKNLFVQSRSMSSMTCFLISKLKSMLRQDVLIFKFADLFDLNINRRVFSFLNVSPCRIA